MALPADWTPRQFAAALGDTVYGNEDAKLIIATALWRNRIRREMIAAGKTQKLHDKTTAFLTGESGSGKSLLMKSIAALLPDVPVITVDANEITAEGFVGGSLIQAMQNLYLAANRDPELANRGVFYFDEMDKQVVTNNGSGNHVRNEAVQNAFLCFLEGNTEYTLFQNVAGESPVPFTPSGVTIITGGACEGLDHDDLSYENLIRYGFTKEFIKRHRMRACMKRIPAEQIEEMISTKFEPKWSACFEHLGIQLSFDRDCIRYIAELAASEDSRGIEILFSELMMPFEIDIEKYSKYKKLHLSLEREPVSQFVLNKKKSKTDTTWQAIKEKITTTPHPPESPQLPQPAPTERRTASSPRRAPAAEDQQQYAANRSRLNVAQSRLQAAEQAYRTAWFFQKPAALERWQEALQDSRNELRHL